MPPVMMGGGLALPQRHNQGGAPAWSPADLPPGVLVAWHHLGSAAEVGGLADGAAVSSWLDRSATADPVTASGSARPIYHAAARGGRACVSHDGEQQYLAGSVARTARHILFAARHRWPAITRPSSAPYPVLGSAAGFSGSIGLNGPGGGGLETLGMTFGQGVNRWSDVGSPTSYSRDGVALPTSAADAGMDRLGYVHEMAWGTDRYGAPLVLGRDRDRVSADSWGRVDIRAAILLSGSATPTERAKCASWLRATACLGALVCCTGDSLTAGYGALNVEAWPAVFDDATGRVLDVPNYAIPGQCLSGDPFGIGSTLLANDAAKLAGLSPLLRPAAVLVAWVGTNDLCGAGRTPAQVLADLKAYVAARKAEGWRVVVATLIDRGDAGGSYRSILAAYNALLRSDHAWADAFVDLAANSHFDPTSGANPYGDTAYYQADLIHLTPLGYALVASLMQAAILSLLPA